MSSHLTKLLDEIVAKQNKILEQQATVDSIEKLTRELEAQKKALAGKATELEAQRKEVRVMQIRLDALTAVDPAINNAMHTKSGTQDVVKHVVEKAMCSEHMTGSEIVQTVLSTEMNFHGRYRGHVLDDFFIDLVNDDDSMKAAVEAVIWENNISVNDVVQHALVAGLNANNVVGLRENILKVVHGVLDEKMGLVESKKMAEGWQHYLFSQTLCVLKLTTHFPAAPKENMPPIRQPQVAYIDMNALRALKGKVANFKPRNDPNQSHNAGGWQALAQGGWSSEGGGGW